MINVPLFISKLERQLKKRDLIIELPDDYGYRYATIDGMALEMFVRTDAKFEYQVGGSDEYGNREYYKEATATNVEVEDAGIDFNGDGIELTSDQCLEIAALLEKYGQ